MRNNLFGALDFSIEIEVKAPWTKGKWRWDSGLLFSKSQIQSALPRSGPTALLYQNGDLVFYVHSEDRMNCSNVLQLSSAADDERLSHTLLFQRAGFDLTLSVDGNPRCIHTMRKVPEVTAIQNAPMRFGAQEGHENLEADLGNIRLSGYAFHKATASSCDPGEQLLSLSACREAQKFYENRDDVWTTSSSNIATGCYYHQKSSHFVWNRQPYQMPPPVTGGGRGRSKDWVMVWEEAAGYGNNVSYDNSNERTLNFQRGGYPLPA
jgi:hypothetical protein